MNPCEECPIDDKIYECCGRFPDSGESVYLQLDDTRWILACPYLDRNGLCTIYENRPLGCRSHFCSRYSTHRRIARDYLEVVSIWETDE